MASVRPDGSGSMGGDWTPSPELLEERELLSGLLDGLADPAAGVPVEEAVIVPEPPAEQPPAVVEPPPEVLASAAAAHGPASVLDSLAADSSTEAPATASVAVPVAPAVSANGSEGAPAPTPGTPLAPALAGTAEGASTPAPTSGSTHAPTPTTESPPTVEPSAVPGPKAIDSLLESVAVENESHADTAQAPAGEARGEALVRADGPAARATEPALASAQSAGAFQAPVAGLVSAHGTASAESRVDGRGGIAFELDCVPADEHAAQPHMTVDVSSSGERTAAAAEQEVPTVEDNQSEAREAPVERSLVPPAGDQTAPDSGWVTAEQQTARPRSAGAVSLVEQPEVRGDLVSGVSQLFDLVPNWPGVDLDAVEDAARSLVEDGSQLGADFVDVVSTHDVSSWTTATATAGVAVGFAIAPPALGLHIRDTAAVPTDEEAELCWSVA